MTTQANKPIDLDRGLASFEAIQQVDVPKARDGKHKQIVTRLLGDIEQLKPGTALKVPLSALPDSKENIRSALNRATRQKGISVETSSDADFLYIWKSPGELLPASKPSHV